MSAFELTLVGITADQVEDLAGRGLLELFLNRSELLGSIGLFHSITVELDRRDRNAVGSRGLSAVGLHGRFQRGVLGLLDRRSAGLVLATERLRKDFADDDRAAGTRVVRGTPVGAEESSVRTGDECRSGDRGRATCSFQY